MKTDHLQSCGHCWVFQICWHMECSTFTASSFRIWTSSTGIPSHPLALFLVMLSKAHLTSHSRMSGSSWVITPLWLSGLWRFFFNSSYVYSCHLFLISSASVRSIPFVSFIVPIFTWNVSIFAWNEMFMVESSEKMRSTEEGNGKLLQYSCLENPVNRQKDRGHWKRNSPGW